MATRQEILALLEANERARTALAARLGPAQNDAQFAFDALQSALRLRTQNLSESFVASYNGREFRGPNAVEDYIAFVQNDFNTKRDIRRDLGVEFNALFPEKERLEKELAQATPNPEPAPPATAAQTVKDDAPAGPTAAPEQKVGPDGRVVDVPPNTAPTNAESTPTQENTAGTTSGTNATVTPAAQSQAIKADSNNGQAISSDPAARTPSPTINPGAAAQPDDNTPVGTPQTAANAEDQTGPNVKPRPNVLDDYASYSYSAAVYLMTEVQYARLLQSTTKKIDGYQLLFQSGGAANNVGGIRPPTVRAAANADNDFNNSDPVPPDGGRNPFFDNDFYIDSITIENLPPGKSTGSAHNVSGLKFTLIEPNGITLLDRLYDAVANHAPIGGDGKVNYTAPTYLMVIRFYGYDANGNLEQVRSKPDQEGTSDPAAIVEKFIPFKIKSLNWGVGTKLVSYEWECVPTGQMIAGYTNRGTIPADVQLVNTTVGGLLGGPAKYSTATSSAANPGASNTATSNQSDAETQRLASAGSKPAPAPAPSKADAAPTNKNTITGGLMGAMNEFQQKLVKDGVFTIADEYAIEFIGPEANKIKDAKLQLPNTKVDKRMTAAGKAPTQDAQSLDQGKTSVDMISRSFSITAGQQLLQAIDLTIRNSSYISDQALVIVNPDGTTQPNPNSRNKPLKWYTIGMSAVAIGDKIDPKRNDYAYKITYTVAAREVKNVISKYFPVSKFSGVHKRYPYWFTGENIAVLEYQETLNAMYNLTVSGGDNEKSAAAKTREAFTSSMSDLVRYNYAPTSTESNKGADGKSLEAAANAAEVLYSPGDLRECKIKIVGDPAWIMQGSTFRVLNNEMLGGTALTTGFLPDGSIAFDNQDVLFEIAWQRPEDYDLSTGLADPYSQTQKKYNNRTALQSRVYLCKKVVSEFRHGAFTQTLEGALYLFPIPSKTNTANPAAAAQVNSAGKNPNITNEVAARTEVDLSTTAGLAARQNAAATDPRRTGSVESANQESAAVLGAQNNSSAISTPSVSTGGGAGTTTGSALGNTGISGSGTNQLSPAGPSNPATTDTGTTVGLAGNAPPKIAENTSPTSPTQPQNQPIVKD
jgi:hypothetical protein